jgi:hypothetical protein
VGVRERERGGGGERGRVREGVRGREGGGRQRWRERKRERERERERERGGVGGGARKKEVHGARRTGGAKTKTSGSIELGRRNKRHRALGGTGYLVECPLLAGGVTSWLGWVTARRPGEDMHETLPVSQGRTPPRDRQDRDGEGASSGRAWECCKKKRG